MKRIFLLLLIVFCSLAISYSQAQYLISEDFSSATFPPTGWTEDDTPGLLSRQTPSAYGTGTGSMRAYFYGISSSTPASLTSPVISGLLATDSISFDYAYANYTSPAADSMFVEFSTDGGATFFTIAAYELDAISTAPPTSSSFVPSASQWAHLNFLVPPSAVGNNCALRLRFRSDFGNNGYVDNIKVGSAPTADAEVVSTNVSSPMYFTSTSYTGYSTVKNNGLSPATFTVTRTINPVTLSLGGYSSTKTVTALGSGSTENVYFDPFIFTPGVTYLVRDSIYLIGDSNPSNDTMSATTTLLIAKTVAILNADQRSTDSLTSHMDASGFAGEYDILTTLAGGSLSNWQTIIVLLGSSANWSAALRDSMKSFLDNAPLPYSGSGVKKSLMIFTNDLGYYNDPRRNASAHPADTLFYRQYLRSMYWGDNWLSTIAGADSTFNGVNDFSGLNNQNVTGSYPDFIMAVNGGSAAFVPATITTGDTCVAVSYSGPTYNMFHGTNQYWAYRPSTDITEAPINVFQKIATWIQTNGGALPVELTSFTSSVNNRDVYLSWSTSTEQNNSGFDIERKSEGSEIWNKIGFVDGSGTVNTPVSYSYSDKGLNTGKYFYRLKQVDFNGNFEYFNLANEVNIGVPDKYALSQNYPNPFNPTTKVNFDLPFDSKVTMKIFDITGREIATLVNDVQPAGYYTVTFDGKAFASGMYFYRIVAEGGNQKFIDTKKMVLIK